MVDFLYKKGIITTDFEYDAEKSVRNKRKHGIDFEEARRLWNGKSIEILTTSTGEQRFIVIGIIDGKHWTAVITYRNKRIRLISIRRARKKEIALYEKNQSF